jgi:hypothetical protein
MVDRPYEAPIDWAGLPPTPKDWSEFDAPAKVDAEPLLDRPVLLPRSEHARLRIQP